MKRYWCQTCQHEVNEIELSQFHQGHYAPCRIDIDSARIDVTHRRAEQARDDDEILRSRKSKP